MKPWLYSLACVAMLLFVVSCSDKSQKDDKPTEGGDQKTETTDISSIDGKDFVGTDTTGEVPDGDTLSRADTNKMTRYEIPVAAGKTTHFCGWVEEDEPDAEYKILIFFDKKGLKGPKKISMGRIHKDDKYSFEFKAPADGYILIAIEKKGLIGFKRQKVEKKQDPPINPCCEPKMKTKSGTITVGSSSTTNKGSKVKVEQN